MSAPFEVIPWDGKPISKPGVYSGIPMEVYHGQLTVGPSISSSGLRTIFNDSLAHFFEGSYLNPANWETVGGVRRRKEEPTSEPFTVGRAAHHLLLGEADFRSHFTIRPEKYPDPENPKVEKPWSGNATWCKNWLAEAKKARLTVLTTTQIENIRGMANSLGRHPLVRAGVLNGLIEHSVVWQDKVTGVWLKWRPDAIPTTDMDFADLKAVADVSDDAIERSIADYGYNMQGALGRIGCREVLGKEMASFSLICAEKTPPYCAQVRSLDNAGRIDPNTGIFVESDLALGERQITAALRLFAVALERDEWPGPGGDQSDAKTVYMKPFQRSRIEFRLALMEEELLGVPS